LTHEDAEIYVYLTAKLMQRQGKELEDFMQAKLKQGYLLMRAGNDAFKNRNFRQRGGEIESPLLKVLRELKKSAEKRKSDPQLNLF